MGRKKNLTVRKNNRKNSKSEKSDHSYSKVSEKENANKKVQCIHNDFISPLDMTEICSSNDCNNVALLEQDLFPFVVEHPDVETSEMQEQQVCYSTAGPYVSEMRPQEYDIAVDECDIEMENMEGSYTTYESLKESVASVVQSPYIINAESRLIQILQLYSSADSTSQPTVKLSITIDEAFCARLSVHRIQVPSDHDFWTGLPVKYDTSINIRAILDKLRHYSVCVGNPDECYQNFVDIGCAIEDKTKSTSAYREENFGVKQGDLSYSSTVRSTTCKFLVQGARCQPCSKVRRNLRDRMIRKEEKKRFLQEKAPPNYMDKKFQHRYMDKAELVMKIKQQQKKIKDLEFEISRLKQQFHKELRNNGVELGVNENMEFTDMMATCQDEVKKAFPDENSLQRLFWKEQQKCALAKSLSGMRWHPMIIRWCLYLKHKSSAAYEAMRNSGFIRLPSSRTLFDYSHTQKCFRLSKGCD